MDNERAPLIKLHINVIIGFWSTLVYIGIFVASFIRSELFGAALPYIRIGFTVLIIVSAGIFGAEFKVFKSRVTFFKSLKEENTYTLGEDVTFFNLEAFRNRVHELEYRPRLRNKQRYIVVFSPTLTKYITVSRNRIFQSLNQKIVDFILKIMTRTKDSKFNRRNAVYAFDRNNFLLYLFADDEKDVHDLITKISNECYRLVNDEKINIFVQPYFGIYKATDKDKSLTSSIEKASIAKLHAQDILESVAYYNDALIDNDKNDFEEISRAVERNEFIPYYQAKVNLSEKRIVSCEVLARWKTQEGTILSPAKFIDRARQSNLLSRIDFAIFEKAMKDLGDSLKRGRRAIPISVNFSLIEFYDDNFVDKVLSVLEKYKIPHELLEIEITEAGYLVNLHKCKQIIKKLNDQGIFMLMDDFGTSNSQISIFRQLPFDGIKIDKSYIDNIVTSEKDRSIVKFLVQLIHDNGIPAIVEGVETKEQVDILHKMKVDIIQGFYFSKPLPFDDYQKLLKENTFEKKGGKKWY